MSTLLLETPSLLVVTGAVSESETHQRGADVPRPRILIVEDERGLTDSLKWYFDREGFETIITHDGQEGLRKAQTVIPDVMLLDLNLPSLDGLSICRELRAADRTRSIPIIMITAKSEETDQLIGYSMGADDYVTKPFSNKILLEKVKVQLRRVQAPLEGSDLIVESGVTMDRVRHKVSFDSHELDLTPTEFRLLECLVRQPGRAFTRHQLMDAAIGEGSIVLERTIDVHIKTLRRKLSEVGADTELIETVRGVGYRFQEQVDSKKQ
jgi:two-component system, OmpR family, phosphate regulon response regulator PhoB